MAVNGGFTLGGKTALELGLRMLRSSKRPILPGTADATTDIAARAGAFDFGAKLSPQKFELDCAILKKSPAELQQSVDALAAFLVDATGLPRVMELEFELKPGKAYSVRYSGALDIDRVVGLGKFTLPLVAYDPFAYGPVISAEASVTAQHTLEVENPGTQEVWPVIVADGSFQSLSVASAGRTLIYSEQVNGTVTIDCERMQAWLAPDTNKLNKVSGQWIRLAPGANTVTIAGTGLNCTVSIQFRPKFL